MRAVRAVRSVRTVRSMREDHRVIAHGSRDEQGVGSFIVVIPTASDVSVCRANKQARRTRRAQQRNDRRTERNEKRSTYGHRTPAYEAFHIQSGCSITPRGEPTRGTGNPARQHAAGCRCTKSHDRFGWFCRSVETSELLRRCSQRLSAALRQAILEGYGGSSRAGQS